jgi:glycosyltransferase involved in cell wall biosynthesis
MSQFSRALRILHILPHLLPDNCSGGAERMAGDLMAALSERHEVAALSLYGLTGSVMEGRLRRAGVSLYQLGKRAGFDPSVFMGLDRVVREWHPHVVHTHLYVLRYALPALLRRPVPLAVHTVHNLAEHEADFLGRIVQRLAFRRRVVPVPVSDQIARSVERVYRIRCGTVIPNCIPVERFGEDPAERVRWRKRHGFSSDVVLLTSVGRLEVQKDPLTLVRAFAAVSDPRVHLLMLGDGALRQRVMDLVRSLQLDDRVHLFGKRDDVAQCLAASDVFVLSSRWEGNPLAVMEAMASGLPVVGTAVGGVPELVESGQHGILVPPGEPAELARAMLLLCRNPETRASMGAAARERSGRQFGLPRMVEAYDALYRTAIAASSSTSSGWTREERQAPVSGGAVTESNPQEGTLR